MVDPVRRLRQNIALTRDVDLDALAARYPDDDDVQALVDLTREARALAPQIVSQNPTTGRSP